jgi:hypothetical protein
LAALLGETLEAMMEWRLSKTSGSVLLQRAFPKIEIVSHRRGGIKSANRTTQESTESEGITRSGRQDRSRHYSMHERSRGLDSDYRSAATKLTLAPAYSART